jgi:integral membrane sensor domain MASE1
MTTADKNALIFPSQPTFKRSFLWIASIALLYFGAARLGLALAIEPVGIAPIWPASGIFLSAILLTRHNLRIWLIGTLFITDFIAEILTGTPLVVGLLYAFILTCDAILSSWLLNRFVGKTISFDRIRDLIGWLLLSVVLSNLLASMSIAAVSMRLHPEISYWYSFAYWITAHGIGNLLVTPLILSWVAWLKTRSSALNPKLVLESLVFYLLLAVMNYFAFDHLSDFGLFSILLVFLTYSFSVWAVLRWGVRGVTLVSVIQGTIAIYFATFVYTNPIFLTHSSLGILFNVQLFLVIFTVPALFLASPIAERKKIRNQPFGKRGALSVAPREYDGLFRSNQSLG